MKELEHLFTAVRDLGGGVKSTDGITPLQVARAHQWAGRLGQAKKRKFDSFVDKLAAVIGENEKLVAGIPEGAGKNRKKLQLKELAKSGQVEGVKKEVERVKLFCTYDADQRKFGIEKALGLRSLALPTRITELASLVGLEIYNSLSDEKKIYLNTEDLLIELKYDVANAEKPLAVDISFTENDEEVKLVAEAADLLAALNGEDEDSLRTMLRSLIRRTSRAVAFLKRDPPIQLRKAEAELETKLKTDLAEDPAFKAVKRVMGGLEVTILDRPGLDTLTKRVRASKLTQRVTIGMDDSGRFRLSLSPEVIIAHGELDTLRRISRNEEIVAAKEEEEDPAVVLPLSYLANRPVRNPEQLFKSFPEIQTTAVIENSCYKFTVAPQSPYNSAVAVGQLAFGNGEGDAISEAVSALKCLHKPLKRIAIFNALLKSCFWFEKLELQSGTRAPIDMDKKPRLRKLLNGAEDKRVQSYTQEKSGMSLCELLSNKI